MSRPIPGPIPGTWYLFCLAPRSLVGAPAAAREHLPTTYRPATQQQLETIACGQPTPTHRQRVHSSPRELAGTDRALRGEREMKARRALRYFLLV